MRGKVTKKHQEKLDDKDQHALLSVDSCGKTKITNKDVGKIE